MSPTTMFLSAARAPCTTLAVRGAGRVYPGYGIRWVPGGAIPGTTHQAIPGSHIDHILEISPTHGQMKGYLRLLMRFPRIGSRMTSEWPQNDPRIDPSDQVPRWSRDGLRSPISRTSDNPWSRIGVI